MARKWPDWDSNAGPADSRVGAPNASIITDEGVIKYFEKYKIPYTRKGWVSLLSAPHCIQVNSGRCILSLLKFSQYCQFYKLLSVSLSLSAEMIKCKFAELFP